MKKLIITTLLLFACITLAISFDPQTVEISRYEEQPILIGGHTAILHETSYERFLEYYPHYYDKHPNSCREIYLPKVGELVTEDGEHFISEVEIRFFSIGPTTGQTSLRFVLRIYSSDGTLIANEEIVSSFDSTGDSITDAEVSKSIEKYWNAVKATPDELFSNAE